MTVERALAEEILQNYMDRADRDGPLDTEQYLRYVQDHIAEWRRRYWERQREDGDD